MRDFRPRGGFRQFGRSGTSPKNQLITLAYIEKYIKTSLAEQSTNPKSEEIEELPGFNIYTLPASLSAAIDNLGFKHQTPIQAKVIPEALLGKDVIGIAQTGTGKTAAFMVPLITRLTNRETKQVLIMAPTRELAVQIFDDFEKLARGSGFRASLCIGGTSVYQQIRSLQRQYQVLIGTPGRILDMWQQRVLELSRFDSLVLDEVDRMLDMGFIHDVREILSKVPTQRQTMFFSATMPKAVEQLCHTFAKNPITLSAKPVEQVYPIDQKLIRLEMGQRKLETLYDLISNQQEFKKVIIFGRTKHGVKRLAEELDQRGFAVDSLHGNKSQAARQRSLDSFKSDRVSVLVATDVGARGIDVANVTHVINYDLPETLEDYIHRIGRTGRAGHTGTAVTLVEGGLY